MAAPTTTAPIRALSSLGLGDVPVAGGKGANLGELIGAGFPVPTGFVITAQTFLDAMAAAGVRDRLAESVRAAFGASPETIEQLAHDARDVIRTAGVPASVAGEFIAAYEQSVYGPVAPGSADPAARSLARAEVR